MLLTPDDQRASTKRRDALRARIAFFAIAIALPCAALFWANYWYTWNHFYVGGPFLHDSGWFSHIVYRQGVYPSNPRVAEELPHYFSLHVSGLVALGSLLSYAFPGDRVDWYCVFQGALYAPLGAAAALLIPRRRRPRALLPIAGIAAAALAFAFDGQAFACMTYPHFEIAISAGVSIMLAGLATSRIGVAGAGLALALATREDGGAHATAFLVAVLACDLVGRRPFPVQRRHVIALTATAFFVTALLVGLQKTLLHPKPLFEVEYLGHPAFAHLSAHVLWQRLVTLCDVGLAVVVPLVATVVLAIHDRDPRWLLGWAAELPWLALNFLAHQPSKAELGIYTGFPFVASIFWVGAYARVKYGRDASARIALGRLAALSLLTTAGFVTSMSGVARIVAAAMLGPQSTDAAALRAYARSLRADPNAYGRILVDPAMASWATESLPGDAVNHGGLERADFASYDAYTFFEDGPARNALEVVVHGRFRTCGALPGTAVRFCGRAGASLPPGFTPVPYALSFLRVAPVARRVGTRVEVPATATPEIAVYGPFSAMRGGRYRVTLRLDLGACAAMTNPPVVADVFNEGRALATWRLGEPRAEDRTIVLGAEVLSGGVRAFEIRTWTAGCPYVVESVDLVDVTMTSPPR